MLCKYLCISNNTYTNLTKKKKNYSIRVANNTTLNTRIQRCVYINLTQILDVNICVQTTFTKFDIIFEDIHCKFAVVDGNSSKKKKLIIIIK